MKVKDTTPREYWEDLMWTSENAQEIHDLYEGECIAVVNKQVVAHGRSGEKVRKEAAKRTGKKPDEIFVTFVDSSDIVSPLSIFVLA